MNIWMKIAYDEATTGMLANEGGPFGAVIVKNDKVIASAHNEVLKTKDPTAHAEINAIRVASSALDSFDLSECVIYTTCQPCPMCLGAILWAGIKTIYYGSTKEEAEKAGFNDKNFYDVLEGKNNKVSMIQLEQEKSTNLFEEWMKKSDRELY